MNPDYTAINILSADRQTDLFHYTIYDGEVTLNLALNGFVNIEKITADKTDTVFSPSEDYAYVQWNSDAKLHITNGNIIEENAYYADGKVLVSGIMVMYMAYGYSSEMMLNISGSPDEAMEYFKLVNAKQAYSDAMAKQTRLELNENFELYVAAVAGAAAVIAGAVILTRRRRARK